MLITRSDDGYFEGNSETWLKKSISSNEEVQDRATLRYVECCTEEIVADNRLYGGITTKRLLHQGRKNSRNVHDMKQAVPWRFCWRLIKNTASIGDAI